MQYTVTYERLRGTRYAGYNGKFVPNWVLEDNDNKILNSKDEAIRYIKDILCKKYNGGGCPLKYLGNDTYGNSYGTDGDFPEIRNIKIYKLVQEDATTIRDLISNALDLDKEKKTNLFHSLKKELGL